MAVAAASRAALHGLACPRSPTLSDADMILPDHDHVRGVSPSPHNEHPPCPPVLYAHTTPSSAELASASQSRRRASPQIESPPLSAPSSRSTLRTMGDAGAPTRNEPVHDDALASSPTIHNSLGSNSPKEWTARHQRRASNASSKLSEDFENWPGFDSHGAFDDSGLGLEELEKRDQFSGDAKNNNSNTETDRWLSRHSSGSDESDGPYSSAALSRRAEIILANAKKRLNAMEGNLRGARKSLVVSPTLNLSRSSSELSLHIHTTRERDRRLYAGLGPIPPRRPSFRSSPLLPTGSPGHLRGSSEALVPLPFSSPSYMTRTPSTRRASSAIGHNSGPWSPESFGQGRFPIKESRSHEAMRGPRPVTSTSDQQYSVRTRSRNSRSPPALETLQEDEDRDGPRVHRCSSAASGLRDQMNDLKGRISSLKLRAQEDQLRRRSMQSLRTSSPFTNAQEWYSGSENFDTDGAPVTANAVLGIETESPTQPSVFDEHSSRPNIAETTFLQREDEKLVNHETEVRSAASIAHADLPHANGVHHEDFENVESYDNQPNFDVSDDRDCLSVGGGHDVELAADSLYEDAEWEMPVTERHEDRVDAFDYEHFFLHSAMGTYSLEGRRSSTGSDTSTATTRPVTAAQAKDEDVEVAGRRVSFQTHMPRSNSTSTVASFATAAEKQSDEEENEQMDQFSEQILAQHQTAASRPAISSNHTSFRSDSAINMRRGVGPSPPQTIMTRGSASPADLASGLQVSQMFSILTECSSPSREEPRLALSEEEKQLIYSLALSFQQVCSSLQHTDSEQYERKAWRRRLDEARRVLNGEDTTDDGSF
ncbi:hypothetical protein BDU57DRAFT_91846 [Ampelomyces quisqualis]|uniref:Uncharacterized protein n=1 Tax=Ampelomyces quisqualis TaxID=50730 RepID=A0A6A5Q999_AMPQU|nr:hypothetical protein BDU57DRAFT_91846 [Ampelomyces quisqualis]